MEGVYTGFQVNKEYWQRRYPTRAFLFGFSGYAFHAKELEFHVGLEKGFMRETRLSIGGEYHRMVDTPDRWILPEEENSLAAFLIEEDYYDFLLHYILE